jgi:excisionase family DNA binding protein
MSPQTPQNGLEKHYRIGQAAELLGFTPEGLRHHLKAGTVQAIRTPGGHWRIPERELRRLMGQPISDTQACVIYARVSSQKQKAAGNLTRQVARLQEFAQKNHLAIRETITDVGSGLNEKRKGLAKVFKHAEERQIKYIVVEFRDRLTRFGYRYVTAYLAAYGVEVLVKEPIAPKGTSDHVLNQELVEDLIAIIYSFSGKLDGRRSAHFRRLRRCVKTALPPAE